MSTNEDMQTRKELDGARVALAATRDLLKTVETELSALRACMEPSRLEQSDPSTLAEALTSLRLWRAGARHVNGKLLAIQKRAGDEKTIQRVFEASLDADTTMGAVGSVVRWVVQGNEKDVGMTQDLRTPTESSPP